MTDAHEKDPFDMLWEDEGGAAVLWCSPNRKKFERPCREYPFDRVGSILVEHTSCSQLLARKHWPWVAFTVAQYESQKSAEKDDGWLRPTDYKNELKRIEDNALSLARSLGVFSRDSLNMALRDAPGRTHHLRHLHGILASALHPSGKVEKRYQPLAMTDINETLFRLADAAKLAQTHFSSIQMQSPRRSKPEVAKLVSRLAIIWTALTDRKASTARVIRKDGSEDPQFVLFIQALVSLTADGETLTRAQVETALLNTKAV